jgi:hypothetical protein
VRAESLKLAVAFIVPCSLLWELACGGVSNDPNGISGQGRSGSGGRAGAAGAAGRAGAAGASGAGGSGALAGAGGSAGAGNEAGAAGAGLGGSGPGATVPEGCPEPTPIPAPGQDIVIRSVTFDTGEVVLQNVSNEDQTIVGGRQGWQWCNFPAYWNIVLAEENVVLSPGETYAFVSINNTMGQWSYDPEGGELGIYTTTGAFTTPSLMRAFVSWADAAQSREPTAVMAGYWTFDERIEIGPNDAGFVITGESNRASGYTGVPARCLVIPPNE